MQYGSLTNMLMDGTPGVEPAVGVGATILMWSDRRAATIIDVTLFKSGARKGQARTITVREDRAIRTDTNGMSDAQNYRYEPNPDGRERTFTRRKDGRFSDGSAHLLVGVRDAYRDYSF